jgi:phospholipase/lecithinase/hemolysin
MRLKILPVLLALSVCIPATLSANAIGTVNKLVVFGDSLSDNGNAAIALGGTLPGNYAPNAFTDGPNTSPATAGPFGLWIDQLAPKLGVPDPLPALLGGSNIAVGTALTGHNPAFTIPPFPPTQVPYTTDQVALFNLLNGPVASPSSLYTFWAGANDLYAGQNPLTAADNIFGNIQTLAAEGGKYFLWLNLPALGGTPLAVATNNVAALNAASNAFNAEWAIDLQKLQAQGIDVIGVNVAELFSQISAAPASFGFTNITDPAQGTSGNPNNYLFWDNMHPTTAANALVATAAFNAFTAAPEPAGYALACAGLLTLLALSKFRKAAALRIRA